MPEAISFDPRVVNSSRKPHKCFACEYFMPKGTVYVAYPGKDESGKFRTLHLCIECSYLLNFKTGEHREDVKPGEFTERRIPNFIKKKRAEFRKNPTQAMRNIPVPASEAPEGPRPVNRLVVKASELHRHIYTVSARRYGLDQFPKGSLLTLLAGVSGDQRAAIIKGAWEVDGTAFGFDHRRIAILLERV